jgi:Ca2+-transporting ATPase
MVSAIAAGRKIYANLKKAIQYVISVHIPIILTVSIPLVLGWIYPAILTPIHVIFLEMIMGPTCSIIYENEPLEKSLMFQKPRRFTSTFFSPRDLIVSIVQGIVISIFVLGIYQYSVKHHFDEPLTRSLVFATLVSANVVLTLVNRSMTKPVWVSLRYRNPLIPLILLITVGLMGLILYAVPVSSFFNVSPLSMQQLLLCVGVGLISVIWIEPIKLFRNRYSKS